MDILPEYVENALNDWESLAFFAYDCYEKSGRIGIGIEAVPEDPESVKFLGFQHDYRNGKPDKTVARLLETYDPEKEIIIHFKQDDGQVRTQRLKTAPGGRHPKRVYFFEMLRRVSEEANSVDISTLPSWLVSAMDALDKSSKK